ncbi:hypothetical protein PISMIDRAFT_675743 [Pisolithus microcarpus 441]|uniref:Unplaced genomic scaffold scaffold_16, whole genome shotgun sequence n=1 Tax=Pisolithus microcarpus 441 TaxID=765257 RepID=A0A0C9YNZ6_9AGAM|nr:hypothetical protein PISMIDRAFT_675743 [Pisolithus microcarpus 441]
MITRPDTPACAPKRGQSHRLLWGTTASHQCTFGSLSLHGLEDVLDVESVLGLATQGSCRSSKDQERHDDAMPKPPTRLI